MSLQSVSFRSWFLMIMMGLYAMYNPIGYSIFHMWMGTAFMDLLPLKLLVSAIMALLLGIAITATKYSIGVRGVLIILTIIGLSMWTFYSVVEFNYLGIGLWSWIAQPIAAFVLTIGLQWSKVWMAITRILPTWNTNENSHHSDNTIQSQQDSHHSHT